MHARYRVGSLFAVLMFVSFASGPLNAQQVIAPHSERYTLPYDEGRGVLSYADYLERAAKSVVRIYNGQYDEEQKKMLYPGHGSGVVYDAAQGMVMTNQHVVDGSDILVVELFDGELVEGELVGSDPSSDIAVVRVSRKLPYESLFIDTNTLRVGDLVFAVGYPHLFDKTVSAGVISGLNRRGFYDKIGDVKIEDYIQTDAAINPGNSGGPLFDSRGRIVGINTMVYTGSDGLGFAVPSNVAVAVARRIVSGGLTEPGWFGATVDSLNPNDAKQHGLTTLRGVMVLEVEENSPAMIAGVKEGDIITGAGGRGIADKYQFANFILLSEMGVSYNLFYTRDKVPHRAKIILTDRNGRVPSNPKRAGNSVQQAAVDKADEKQSPEIDSVYGAKVDTNSRGEVEVTAVTVGSRAFGKGLKVGDLIVSVNSSAVGDAASLLKIVDSLDGKAAAFSIRRNNSTFNLII